MLKFFIDLTLFIISVYVSIRSESGSRLKLFRSRTNSHLIRCNPFLFRLMPRASHSSYKLKIRRMSSNRISSSYNLEFSVVRVSMWVDGESFFSSSFAFRVLHFSEAVLRTVRRQVDSREREDSRGNAIKTGAACHPRDQRENEIGKRREEPTEKRRARQK